MERIPAGRWGSPKDFEAAVVFLAGPGSDYVCGESLVRFVAITLYGKANVIANKGGRRRLDGTLSTTLSLVLNDRLLQSV